jgi:hypothetical protein
MLSLQQILYKSLVAGTFNKSYLTNYLTYVQELINKDNGNDKYLDPLYKNILYWINNYLLLPRLESHDNKIISKTEINQIINQINLLNKGNSALGVKGLEKQLTISGLVQYKEVSEVAVVTKDIDELFKPILNLSDRLRIQTYDISEDRESVSLQTEIFSAKIRDAIKGESLRARITLFKNKGNLYVRSITLINEPNLNTFLESYLETTPSTLIQILNIIDENIAFYHEAEAQPVQTICEVLQQDIGNANMISCDDTMVDIFKEGINYNFTLVNGVLDQVTISDK